MYSVKLWNKNQLRRPIANLSCFEKKAYFADIKIFNNLPSGLLDFINNKQEKCIPSRFHKFSSCVICDAHSEVWNLPSQLK
jgi:hypothetical protein